jgi:hypothetical protein
VDPFSYGFRPKRGQYNALDARDGAYDKQQGKARRRNGSPRSSVTSPSIFFG